MLPPPCFIGATEKYLPPNKTLRKTSVSSRMPTAKRAVWLAQMGQLLLVLAAWLLIERPEKRAPGWARGFVGDDVPTRGFFFLAMK